MGRSRDLYLHADVAVCVHMISIQVPVLMLQSEHMTKVPVVATDSLATEEKMLGPMVFSNFSAHMNSLKDTFTNFEKRLTDDLKKSKGKQCMGRVVDDVDTQTLTAVEAALRQAFSELPGFGTRTMIGPIVPQALVATCVPNMLPVHLWASGHLVEATATNKFQLASLQYVAAGTRTFAAVKYSTWLAFLRKRGSGASQDLGSMKQVTPQQAREQFRELNEDLLKEFCGDGLDSVYIGVVNAGQALWVPPVFLVCDVSAASLTIGMKMAAMYMGDFQVVSEFSKDPFCGATQKPEDKHYQLIQALQSSFIVLSI